jgi:hypothetical protein
MRKSLLNLLLIALVAACLWLPAAADEGMWTFDNPPLKQLKEKYGFTPTQQWLDHLRLSSVRFNDGGSGSFVSPTGLVLTNHHVALGQLQKVSTAAQDYVKNGFYARTQAKELKCPDLELNVLVSLEDVTKRVQGAVKPAMSDADALKARRAEAARIEKESQDSTGLRSDVVALYQGGEYWLYRYKRYTDVRLVFAPEQQAAFYGGDPDNFTYPRYDIDMALFRVYENGQPVKSADYLKWNAKGAGDGELVFVSGHPGSTDRLFTMSQLTYERDSYYPLYLKSYRQRLAALRAYAARGEEQARQAANQIFSMENSLKVRTGEYNGLLDQAILGRKQQDETDFRRLLAQKPDLNREFGGAWEAIAGAEQKHATHTKQEWYYTFRALRLPTLARQIVQYVAEVKKPDGERLPDYQESKLESLRFRMFSPAPLYAQMEQELTSDWLTQAAGDLGAQDQFVKTILNGRAPAEAARELFAGTKLTDASFRKSLVEGGEAAVAVSTDPLIVMARKIDPIVRENEKWLEDNVDSVLETAGEKIGRARFAIYGKSIYPDCTFTLRLSYGAVKGYPMNGTLAPYKTAFYGLYERAADFDNKPPFNLPERIAAGRTKLDLSTPLNFVSTNDIIGGNSGSPVVNRNGEIVGLIFDGNIESLVGRFVYNIENNRAVAVHTAGMIEVLRKLYGAGALADELEGGGNRATRSADGRVRTGTVVR